MIKPLQSITLKNDNGEDTTYVVASAPAIVETTDPADVASFADGAEGIPVKSLIADINPVQNLNGQSAPYPAGGGKNLLNPTGTTATDYGIKFTVNADGTVNANGTASGSASFTYSETEFSSAVTGTYLLNGNPTGASSTTYRMRMRLYSNGAWGSWIYANGTNDVTIEMTAVTKVEVRLMVAGGQSVSNILFKPMLRLSSVSDASYAPYSNICPITGWTGMNVYRKGKNLLDDSIRYKTGNNYYIGSQNTYTIPLAAGTYTFSVEFLNGSHYGAFCREENAPSGVTIWGSSATTSSETITLPAGNYTFWLYKSGGVTEADIGHVQLEVGSSTTYEPYTGTTYPISWADEAGTVYGGTLDVTNGLLTVDMGYVDMGTLNWSYLGNGVFAVANIGIKTSDAGNKVDAICSLYPFVTYNELSGDTTKKQMCGYSSDRIYVRDISYSDAATFKTEMVGQQFVYELATPVTYQLTPQAVMTILGQNNIWADTGDVETAYCADTKMYIDKVIAAL